jgi:dTMP kinase
VSGASAGAFIVLEGPDGAGKTTQAGRLVAALASRGLDPVRVREPGGTSLGERVRAILLDPDEPMSVRAEMFLFQAARAQLTDSVIRPALAAGRVVVADRFYASTAVYQGHAGPAALPLGIERAIELSVLATGGLVPDVTILLDLAPERAVDRLDEAERETGTDRFEARDDAFRRAVREGYRRYAELAPEPVALVDADRAEDAVAADVLAHALAVLDPSGDRREAVGSRP